MLLALASSHLDFVFSVSSVSGSCFCFSLSFSALRIIPPNAFVLHEHTQRLLVLIFCFAPVSLLGSHDRNEFGTNESCNEIRAKRGDELTTSMTEETNPGDARC